MSLYNQEYNKDNVVLRYIIVATLAELKSQLYYYNLVDDKRVKVDIPFYYSTTGEERFLQDNFLYDTVDQGKAIGDYEVVPRGILQLQGFSINTDELTNKYVDANYIILCNDGIVRTLVAETNFIPITLNFDTTIVVTNTLEILKVSEVLVSKLYKSKLFYVDLGMCTMQSLLSIPEDFSEEKPFEFQVDTKKEYQITFSTEVKSFIPVLPHGIALNHIHDMMDEFVNKHPGNTDVLTLRYSTQNDKFSICANGIMETIYVNTNIAAEIMPDTNALKTGEIDDTKIAYTETAIITDNINI